VNGSCAPDDDLTLIDEVALLKRREAKDCYLCGKPLAGPIGATSCWEGEQMPIKIFFAQGNELIGQLESDINEWRKNLDSRAEVTHIATSATEHKDGAEGWQPRIVITVWYEL
jgi:hypothetical protein